MKIDRKLLEVIKHPFVLGVFITFGLLIFLRTLPFLMRYHAYFIVKKQESIEKRVEILEKKIIFLNSVKEIGKEE